MGNIVGDIQLLPETPRNFETIEASARPVGDITLAAFEPVGVETVEATETILSLTLHP